MQCRFSVRKEGGRGGVVIELLILESLSLPAQDEVDSALTALQRAIALAEQESYMRVFVDEGEPMLRLLRLFVAYFGTTNYSTKLLSALGKKAETPEVLN